MNILVSACLLGERCRYDGESRADERVVRLGEKHVLIPFCPETAGGLPVPREPAEIREGRVCTRSGEDVTQAYRSGAEKALEAVREHRCSCAVLKERSPSCGSSFIHDGSFSGKLISGEGVTCRLIRESGIPVCSEESLSGLPDEESGQAAD